MNRRYIDFVPTHQAVVQRPAVKKVPVEKPVEKIRPQVQPKPQPRAVVKTTVIQEEVFEPNADTFAIKDEPKYGVVEEYRPVFINHAPVEKRPLSQPHFKPAKTELETVKAVKVSRAPISPRGQAENDFDELQEFQDLQTPKTPFVKNAQVEKRPLSKNVYKKPTPIPVEEPTGPIAIIDKPEKDAHISLIITIILTIVLGAAVGTIAFLLLPR